VILLINSEKTFFRFNY